MARRKGFEHDVSDVDSLLRQRALEEVIFGSPSGFRLNDEAANVRAAVSLKEGKLKRIATKGSAMETSPINQQCVRSILISLCKRLLTYWQKELRIANSKPAARLRVAKGQTRDFCWK